jgi:hypothetical protein
MKAAATTRRRPNRSPNTTLPIRAATSTLVSRNAATTASAPRRWAQITSP